MSVLAAPQIPISTTYSVNTVYVFLSFRYTTINKTHVRMLQRDTDHVPGPFKYHCTDIFQCPALCSGDRFAFKNGMLWFWKVAESKFGIEKRICFYTRAAGKSLRTTKGKSLRTARPSLRFIKYWKIFRYCIENFRYCIDTVSKLNRYCIDTVSILYRKYVLKLLPFR